MEINKSLALQRVKNEMESDKSLPLVSKPEDIIPGEGNPDAKIVFIGEAGGYYESLQRRPFVGAAGKLLEKAITFLGLKRTDIYITNMVKTRPPSNRDPFPEELKAFERYLDAELNIIKPKFIITLGRFSMAKFLQDVKITQVHGQEFKKEVNGRHVTVIPMFHPAAALRNPTFMRLFKFDFVPLKKLLEKNV